MRKLYKILLAALLTATAFSAHSATVTIDGIKYESSSDGTYAIVSEDQSQLLTTANILPSVTIENKDLPVTEIGSSAFYRCSNLTSVTIPTYVTEIGDYAFYGCTSLTKLIYNAENCSGGGFNDSYNWLSGCTSLIEIEIGESVKTIPNYAFYKTPIKNVTISNSVTSIGKNAFYYCSSLTSLTIPTSVTEIGDSAFYGCTSLTKLIYNAENCSGIGFNIGGYYWLAGCTSLTEIEIGESVKTIQSYAFYGLSTLRKLIFNAKDCSSISSSAFSATGKYITEIEIGNNVKTIPGYAFSGTAITSITIPNSVTVIGSSAFYNCSNLTSVTISNSVTSIGNFAFRDCSSLTSVTIPNSVTSIGYSAFWNCSSLTSVTIPNSVTKIGQSAFYDCSSLTSVTIPNSVSSIESCAFCGCSSLVSVTIPNSVTLIEDGAFSGCSSLTNVTIPNSVTSIEYDAFRDCSSLTSITIPNSVSSFGNYVFRNCSNLTKLIYNAENCSGDGFSYSKWLDGCTSLTEIEIGESVKTIPAYAFYKCTSLTKLIFKAENCSGGGFSTGSSHWLYDCTSLTEIKIGESVKTIPDYAFYETPIKSITIPTSVTSIGNYAFRNCSSLTKLIYNAENCSGEGFRSSYHWLSGCTSLTEIEIGESVKRIPSYAFYKCTSLTKLIFKAENCSGGGFSTGSSHWLYDCTSLTEIEIGEGVKIIPSYAFYNTPIKSVPIPNSVTEIGSSAFYECEGLTSVNISSLDTWLGIDFGNSFSNPTYYAKKLLVNGETIRRLTLPEDLTEIKGYAFVNCEPLVTVNCGSNIKKVGTNAFGGCTGLQRFYFDDLKDFLQINYASQNAFLTYGNKAEIYINGSPFEGKTKIQWPESLVEIPDYAFYGENLTDFSIPETVISIGAYAFANTPLTEIKLPDNLERIGVGAFSQTKLTTITIPKKIKAIGNSTFYNCTSLTSVSFLAGLQTIGSSAFRDCTSLTSVSFPAGLQTIGDYAFSGCRSLSSIFFQAGLQRIDNYAFRDCTSLTSVSFPAGLQTIGDYAFSGCTTLTSASLPLGLETIGNYAFNGCTSLTSVPLPLGLETIGEYAFSKCSRLTSVSFPTGLKTIGKYAFENCTSLSEVSFAGGLQTIGNYAFNGCSKLTQVDIEDVNRWAQVEFGNNTSNPIYYAKTFKQWGMNEPVRKLDLKYGDKVSGYAFYNASNLNTVRVDCDVVGTSAFYRCDNVTDLCIDAREIESYAFSGMTNLKTIYSLTSTPPVAPDNVFSNYTGIKLYVPKGAVSAYENAENCWWRFLDVYESDFSDLDKIFAPNYVDGVDDVTADDGARVYSENGCICVETPDVSARVAVYSMNGTVLHNGVGGTRLASAPGLYIVTVNGRSTKLAVL